MVQPPLQQTSKDANWKVFSKTGKKAFPETASPAQNIQHQHHQNKLLLQPQHGKHHQAAQRQSIERSRKERSKAMQLSEQAKLPIGREMLINLHHL
jgi:hypothetical protein